ncbi:hypothetical protein Salat_0948700 [Sesamum alatum]|uniref:Uncharacterized protein n=1 Tax=Sesamum alatum TaxID=300844 RepID=A0AAE1YLB0_9LAMI|nr:hypothetical protein Salat_0948700 [Sesamum alatum]
MILSLELDFFWILPALRRVSDFRGAVSRQAPAGEDLDSPPWTPRLLISPAHLHLLGDSVMAADTYASSPGIMSTCQMIQRKGMMWLETQQHMLTLFDDAADDGILVLMTLQMSQHASMTWLLTHLVAVALQLTLRANKHMSSDFPSMTMCTMTQQGLMICRIAEEKLKLVPDDCGPKVIPIMVSEPSCKRLCTRFQNEAWFVVGFNGVDNRRCNWKCCHTYASSR